MMDASHMAFDGHLEAGNRGSHDEMASLHLDFDSLIASEHALNPVYSPFEPCTHDDACLHFTQPNHVQEKNHPAHAQTPPANSSSRFSRHKSQMIPADRIFRSRTPMGGLTGLDHSHDYNWDHIFNDNALANCNFHTSGGLDDHCKDDDCASIMSCSSACEGSCPSQCGETSHGVCCDDDACGSPQLCVDEECHGANRPCTDEKCVADAPVKAMAPPISPPMTNSDKAAAAALASFGDNQPHFFQNAFLQQSLPRDGSMNFLNPSNSMPCSSLSVDSFLNNVNGLATLPNQPFQRSFEYALASHIMQYHNPAHGITHQGPCLANDPSQLLTKCTLPKYNPNDLANTDPYLPQLPSHECGFPIQDPNEFAQHIFQEHAPGFMVHANQYGFHSHHHHGGPGPFFNFNTAPGSQPFSPSPSPLTNLSMVPSLSSTPVSLPTPSALDSDIPLDVSNTPSDKPSSLAGEPRAQVMGHEDQYLCRWVMGNGVSICGQRFENDEQLQKHCKHDHLKQLKKMNGGFRCGWANCTRDTCFTQRSKAERHMQVHTGYKPVQCSICGAALSAKQALDQHMRIHTGETPWVCKFPGCGCAFKQQSALTMHERTHTGDKPLECEICGKRFSESSNLSKHRRTHNVKGMHECQLCGKDFHRLDQLRRHMGTNHKDRPAEVDALLSEAKNKLKTHKVSKVKKAKAKSREGKLKETDRMKLNGGDDGMNVIRKPSNAVAMLA